MRTLSTIATWFAFFNWFIVLPCKCIGQYFHFFLCLSSSCLTLLMRTRGPTLHYARVGIFMCSRPCHQLWNTYACCWRVEFSFLEISFHWGSVTTNVYCQFISLAHSVISNFFLRLAHIDVGRGGTFPVRMCSTFIPLGETSPLSSACTVICLTMWPCAYFFHLPSSQTIRITTAGDGLCIPRKQG